MRARGGFTLIEMIIFVGIFALSMAAFMAVVTNVGGVQVRQSAAAEVSTQSQFVLQTVQYYVQRSSLIEIATDTAVSTLRLRMPSSSEDPVIFSLSSGRLQLAVGGGAAQNLTSSQVSVSNLSFTRRANAGGHDVVAVAFTIDSVNSAPQMRFSNRTQSSAARASSALFGFDLTPDTAGTRALGATSSDWRAINDTIFFSGSNVGIAPTLLAPSARMHLDGDVRIENGYLFADTAQYDGVVLKSSDGNCWVMVVNKDGDLFTDGIACL